MQQDKDPLGEPFCLSAVFAVVGGLYVLAMLLNLWSAIITLFR